MRLDISGNINVNVNVNIPQFVSISNKLDQLLEIGNKLMATDAEVVVMLQDAQVLQRKTIDEIGVVQGTLTSLNAEVARLNDIIAAMGNDASPELVAAATETKRLAQLADEQLPDVPVPVVP